MRGLCGALSPDQVGTAEPRVCRAAASDTRVAQRRTPSAAPGYTLDCDRRSHASRSAAAPFQQHATRFRSDLEISTRWRNGDRAFIAWLLLPGLRFTPRWRRW